jgi:hypothetical protein
MTEKAQYMTERSIAGGLSLNGGRKRMTFTVQRSESVSLAALLGESSMLTWTRALLEERRGMDCEAELDDFEGTTEFQGLPPYVELIGHLCEVCLKRREAVSR